MAMSSVKFEAVNRHFGNLSNLKAVVKAVDNVSFEVRDGEFFSFLGPSGSGKTTCLRLIAGFESPDGGEIWLSGQKAAHLPPFERDVHTVFQDYALFPHMSVLDNVAYSLMLRGISKRERYQAAEAALAMVRLEGLGKRKPQQLSGGQRQRVALARALVDKPKLLLLDEPLGALDLKLRQQMQVELKNLQKSLGITFIYVTHDQEEALAMSDRIAIFNAGRLEQISSPKELYEKPATSFVANFVGSSNLLPPRLSQQLGAEARAMLIRPERLEILPLARVWDERYFHLEAKLIDKVFLGMYTRYLVRVEDTEGIQLQIHQQNSTLDNTFKLGDDVLIRWPRSQSHFLDA